MSLKAAQGWHPQARRARELLSLAACLAGAACAGCANPQPEVIARFQNQPEAGPGGANAGGSGGASNAEAGVVPIPPQRGRVRVTDGKLVTDRGTPLRGAVLPVDTGFMLSQLGNEFNPLNTLAETTGLNALHVYLENSMLATGSMELEGDAIVSQAAQSGLYVIIGMGTGMAVGAFDQAKLTAFWAHYAPRYANETHVLFEIQNNPENSSAPACRDISAKTINMEATVYKQIRAVAPDTHIVLFSTTTLVQRTVFSNAVAALGPAIDWSNASFGMTINSATSASDCLQLADLAGLTSAAKSAGNIALLVGQLPHDNWGPYIQRFEPEGIGWLLYRFFALSPDLTTYRSAMLAAGVTWCPERGTFPVDSSTCN